MIHPRLLAIAGDAIRAGIPVSIRILNNESPGLATGTADYLKRAGYDSGQYFLEVEGFYKNGSVVLIHNESQGYVEIVGRYDRLDVILDGEPDVKTVLPYINHTEYLRWRDRGFTLDSKWVPLLVAHNLIRPVTKVTYESVEQ